MSVPLPQRVKGMRLYRLLRLFRKRLSDRGCRIVQLAGVRLVFGYRTLEELERLDALSGSQYNERPFLDEFIRGIADAEVIYDVGANIGVYSLVAGKVKGRKVQIHAFEPERRNYKALVKNLRVNDLGYVATHEVALGDRSARGMLALGGDASGVGTHHISFDRDASGVPTRIESIDNLVSSGRLPPPDVVKIDVEGYELHVLRGMMAIARSKPLTLLLEWHGRALGAQGSTAEDLFSLAGEMGFTRVEQLDVPDRDERYFVLQKRSGTG